MPSPRVKSVIDRLWAYGEDRDPPRVYALLDAARDESIYPKVLNCGLPNACLYGGGKARELAWVAPYLVELRPEDPFTEWLVEEGWGKSWGVFAGTPSTLNELRRHLRSFLTVYDEEGRSLYFRYYDPRVLRVYLPTCNAKELEEFFGPIEFYLAEQEDPGLASEFKNLAGTLKHEKYRVRTG